MSQTTSDTENMLQKDRGKSPSLEEGISSGSLAAGVLLKKGPWTSSEDALLVDYVKKHGEGNWNAVQKHSGLFRCGKSCRLRWANHLRPNLKKGAFTAEEERLIVELHAKMGNKWARMAAHLPGRTDNEIKNYWNTRIKRLQRAGLPLYPPDLCAQYSSENQQNQSASDFSTDSKQYNELLHGNNHEIHLPLYDNLRTNQGVLSYAPSFPDISLSNVLSQGHGSPNYGFINSTIHGKRLRESENLFTGFQGGIPTGLPSFEVFPYEPPDKIPRAFGYPYDPKNIRKNLAPIGGAVPGSHALLNGNFSTSMPLFGSVKLELPSLQCADTEFSSLLACPPSPLDAGDVYIQSPSTVPLQSEVVSPRSSGLLEAMVYQPRMQSNTHNQRSEQSSKSPVVKPRDLMESPTLNFFETDWESHSDPVSPLGLTAASVFNQHTPISSLDEFPPSKSPPDLEVELEIFDYDSMANVREKDVSSQLLSPRRHLWPDTLLELGWLENTKHAREHSMLNDALSTLLHEDLCSECKQAPCGMSSTCIQVLRSSWNKMPRVCQMSEQPILAPNDEDFSPLAD